MSENILVHLGRELKKLREVKTNFSQVEFAKILNISRSLVCKVEAGERKFNKDLLEDVFIKLSLDNYDKLKLNLFSGFPFKLNSTDDDRRNIIKLTLELKSRGLVNLARNFIKESLLVLDESIDFYVLLSTINLLEKNYSEAEISINKALSLYKSGYTGITNEMEIYHNYGNIFFNMSYDFELKRIALISKLSKQGLLKKEIIVNKDYKDLVVQITQLYNKTEEYFLQGYKTNADDVRILVQISRLYFNIASLNTKNKIYIDKAYTFLSKSLTSDNISNDERIELTILLSIIMAFKDKYESGIILLNNVLIFQKDNYLAYFAKSIIYSYEGKDNQELLNLANDNLRMSLIINHELKYQVLGELCFDNIRKNESTRKELDKILL